MKTKSKTWWGKKFIAALEEFTDTGRLTRGKAYRTDRRIKKWQITDNQVTAKILGNENPYFGVTKAPTYTTKVELTPISTKEWDKVIAAISINAGAITRLMMNDMPNNIEALFQGSKVNLLPANYKDFKVSCSCPDYAVPCKHIAGVCYRLSELFDNDPFLLFELRGLSRKQLHQKLGESQLGKALLQSLFENDKKPEIADSYLTRPQTAKLPSSVDINDFWYGKTPFPTNVSSAKSEQIIPALIIKKGGDFPSFWQRDNSYLAVMEDFYKSLRKHSQKYL